MKQKKHLVDKKSTTQIKTHVHIELTSSVGLAPSLPALSINCVKPSRVLSPLNSTIY